MHQIKENTPRIFMDFADIKLIPINCKLKEAHLNSVCSKNQLAVTHPQQDSGQSISCHPSLHF